MKKTKKLLALLSALSLIISTLPMALASETETEITTLVLEENGTALVNGGTEYVTGYGYTEIFVNGEEVTPDAVSDSYTHNWTDTQEYRVRYYPKLTAGAYKVYVYVPANPFRVPLLMDVSDGTENQKMSDSSVLSTLDYGQSISEAKYVEYGTYFFTGVYGKDYIELKESLTNSHSGYKYNTGWAVDYDSVKFEKVSASNRENVDSLIVEENGQSLVNGAEEYVENYGFTKTTGTYTVIEKDTVYHGGSAYKFAAANNQTNYVTYYPVLNEGNYKVSVYIPKSGYQSGLTIIGSDGTSKTTSYVQKTPLAGYFKEIGTYNFEGVFGTDYIKVTDRTQSGVAANWGQLCDAIKFEKVERVGAWSFEDADGTDSIGKYTWTVAKGESVDTVSDGFKGKGWKIVRPTVENDTESTQSSAVKLKLPSDMKNGIGMSINLWVRNDGTGWSQNIIEVLQNDSASTKTYYRMANVGLENAEIKTYIRGTAGNPEKIGNSKNNEAASSIDVGRGEWHMVTLTYYANTATQSAGAFTVYVYYDGVLVGGGALDNANGKWTNTLQEYTEIYIGADHNGKNRFNGEIDELEIYDGTLTENQVKLLYDKEKRAASSITDNTVNMSSDTAVGTDNSIVLSAPGVTASSTDFEASATSNGIFDGELVYVSNIPDGIYVSNVTAADDAVTVTFAGTAAEAVKQTIYMRAAVQAYGDNTANSDRQIASLLSVYDMKLVSGSVTDEVYTASILNNSYVGKTVDAVVAVYNADGSMKDVYLGKEITVPTGGSTFTVTTDTLNYTAGDTVKLFVFDSIATIKPVNMYK